MAAWMRVQPRRCADPWLAPGRTAEPGLTAPARRAARRAMARRWAVALASAARRACPARRRVSRERRAACNATAAGRAADRRAAERDARNAARDTSAGCCSTSAGATAGAGLATLSMGCSTESRIGVLTASASAPAARTRPVDGRDSEASEFGPGLSRESPFGATDCAVARRWSSVKRRQWGTQAILTIPSIMPTHHRGAVMGNRKKCSRDVDPSMPRSCNQCRRTFRRKFVKTYLISIFQPAGPPPPAEVLEPVMCNLAALQ